MAAKHPRLTITMQPTLHAIFRRLSELTGQSQSQIVFELLDGSQNQLMRVIQLLEKTNDARESLHGKIGSDLQDAQDRVERQLGLVLDDLGEPEYLQESFATERVPFRSRPKAALSREGAPLAGKRLAAKRPLGVVEPPLSNRGVRSLTKQGKTTSSGQKS